MKQVYLIQLTRAIIVMYLSLPLVVFSQNDSTLLIDLNTKKQVLNRKLKVIQDSIMLIDKQLNIIESKKKIGEIREDVFVFAKLKKGNIIRNGATPAGQTMASVPPGEKVELIGLEPNDYWLVKYGDIVGYVSDVFVVYDDEVKTVADKIRKRGKEDQVIKRKADIIKKYGAGDGMKILNGYYWIGMTDGMARESLGSPSNINRTVGSWGVHEQWVYSDKYLYFENGVLTSYQN